MPAGSETMAISDCKPGPHALLACPRDEEELGGGTNGWLQIRDSFLLSLSNGGTRLAPNSLGQTQIKLVLNKQSVHSQQTLPQGKALVFLDF